MKKHFLSVALIALACLPALSRADMKAGDKPTLKFKAFGTKKDVDLADFKGKIIVVDFWATWCHPCMNEAEHMVSVNEKYQSKGLQFIGISLDSDQNALKKVIADKKFTWPQNFEGQGWKGATPVAWGINSIPQTFIIGPDGTVLWRGHPAEIDAPLAAAFKDHPPVLVDPKVAEQARTALDSIESDIAANQSAKAVKLLASIPEAAKADPDIASRLTADTTKLEDFGNTELAGIDPLIASKDYAQAIHKLRDLSQAFSGLPVAKAANAKLVSLSSDPKVKAEIAKEESEKSAQDALTSANQLKADKKDLQAYPSFKAIVKSFPGTTAATEAAAAVKAYEADPAFVSNYNNNVGKKQAESLLTMADNYRAAGNAEKARAKYQAVIDQFPKTTWAETARKALTAMGTSAAVN